MLASRAQARLSEYLRRVRRDTRSSFSTRPPHARIVPYAPSAVLAVREPLASYRTLRDVPLPPPLKLTWTSSSYCSRPAERGVIAYLDSSVILRHRARPARRLSEWKRLPRRFERLAEVECLRTDRRLRWRARLSVEETARRREAIYRVMEPGGGRAHGCR